MSTIEVCDLMLSTADAASGEVRANIGNTVDGVGFGAAVPMWGVDGLLSRPNAAANGKAAQGLYLTQGNQRRVFASRDTRWAGPFGAMGEGDRALVSDCDAGLWLDRSANAIKLASAGGAAVTVGPSSVTVTFGGGTVTLSAGSISASFVAGAVTSTVTLDAATASLSYVAGAVVSSLALTVAGLAIVVPGGPVPVVTINGLPLTVP